MVSRSREGSPPAPASISGSLRHSYSSSHRRSSQQQHAPPPAASVAGSTRSSTTVRPSSRHHQKPASQHRYAKSHAGFPTSSASSSSTHATKANEFPCFERSGDVEILLVAQNGRKDESRRYVLHRLYLAQCSAWFEDVLGFGDNSSVVSGASNVTADGLKRLRFELDRARGDDIPMLVLKPMTSIMDTDFSRPPPLKPKPPPPSSGGFFRSMSNFTAMHMSTSSTASLHSQSHLQEPEDDVLRTYDNLFRIFYNHTPLIDSQNIATAYAQCKTLLQLASAYESLSVIGPRVDHHLLRFGSRLWRQIAKYPPSYLKLGYLARSRAIFSEALIHVVGGWPRAEGQLKGQISREVLDLIEDKAEEVFLLRQKIEAKLFRLTLTTSRGERVTPGLSFLDWLVMSLWRQWLTENTTSAPVGILKDTSSGGPPASSASAYGGGGRSSSQRVPRSASSTSGLSSNHARTFRLIASGGSAYLSHDEVKRFLKLCPDLYSRENLKRAERRLDELKNLARDAVQPLTRNFLELDVTGSGKVGDAKIEYLSCVRVLEGEWPWDE